MRILTRAAQQAAPASANDLTNKNYVDNKIANHNHPISQVEGLQELLNDKALSGHTHTIAQVTNLQATLNAKAPLASPTFTGTPKVPTISGTDNSNRAAPTSYVERRAADHAAAQASSYYTTLRNELIPLINNASNNGGLLTPDASRWVSIEYRQLPAGGTWAFFCQYSFYGNGGASGTSTAAGVAAGGSDIQTVGGISQYYTISDIRGFAWRIA